MITRTYKVWVITVDGIGFLCDYSNGPVTMLPSKVEAQRAMVYEQQIMPNHKLAVKRATVTVTVE
jgi:hypothetical protein